MPLAAVEITKFWDVAIRQWVTTPPTVNTGAEIGFMARVTNTSGQTITMSVRMVIYNPDGSVNDDYFYAFTAPPFYSGGIPWYVDANMSGWAMVPGVYRASAYVSVGGVQAASAEGVVMATATGALSAKINDWNWWDPSAADWSPGIPNKVLMGQEIGLQPAVVNQSSVPVTVHLDLVIHDPDDIKTTLHGSQVTLQDGGSSNPAAWATWDMKWQATKEGNYYADLTLYGPDGVLDQVTGIGVAYVQPGTPTPSGHIRAVTLHDITAASFFTPTQWPVEMDLNHVVSGSVEFFNDSTVPITVKLSVWFTRPGSTTKRALYSETPTVPVGGSKTLATQTITVDVDGYWYLRAQMDVSPSISSSWNAIAAEAPLPQYAQVNLSVVSAEEQEPLSGVSVVLNGYSATTSANGTCKFLNLPVRSYTLTCTKLGYQDYTRAIILGQGTNTIEVFMESGIPSSCLIDGDCPEGYVCRDGVCVPKEAGVPWGWLLLGGGAVAVAFIVLNKKKEKK
jgi:hypothetical protein